MHPNDAEQQHDSPIFRTVGNKLTCINGFWHCSCGLWNRPTSNKCSKCKTTRHETTCPKCGEKFNPKVSD